MYISKKDNIFFIISVFIYLLISVLSIYSASMYLSPTLGNLPLKQLFWYVIGIGMIYVISRLNNKLLYKYSWYIYLFNILLLISLLFIAPVINGSKSWFVIGNVGTFQPSEFMKISLILIIASLLSYFFDGKKTITLKDEFKVLITVAVILIIPTILTFLQPDTGIVIIYMMIVTMMLFVSGIRKRWFIILGGIVLVFAIFFLFTYFYNKSLFIDLFGSSFFYRMDRIINWKSGTGMQLNNSLAAIGSSGLGGHGFNNTPLYFPEAGTDFIFTVFASNFGLVGSLALVLFLLYFDIKVINIGKNCVKRRDKYVIAGICGILIYQQIQNIGMTIGIIPITGITLPMVSYGGSSLLSYMIMIGIIINIDIFNQKKKSYNLN